MNEIMKLTLCSDEVLPRDIVLNFPMMWIRIQGLISVRETKDLGKILVNNVGKCHQLQSCTTTLYVWEKAILNKILFTGISLYGCINRYVSKDLLVLTDVPKIVSVDNNNYNILVTTTNNEPGMLHWNMFSTRYFLAHY